MTGPVPLARLRAAVCAAALALAAGGAPAAGAACSEAARAAAWQEPFIDGYPDLAALTAHLARHRVVYVGEIHDRFEHHLTQLEIVCRLHAVAPLALGVEFFPASAQHALDAYVMRHGDLDRLLRESSWFARWGHDPRLYAPILRFARRHRIRVVALNVAGDLVRRVARDGLASLAPGARARLPRSVHRGPPGYVARVRRSFAEHPAIGVTFERFLDAQLMWDEGMAERGARFLVDHPRATLVILAGDQHVRDDAIPARLARRVPLRYAIVVQTQTPGAPLPAPHVRVHTAPLALPPAARLGVRLATTAGAPRIAGFADDSAARDAGLVTGDRIVAVDGRPLAGPADLRLALWQRVPGAPLAVTVRRGGRETTLMLTLR